MRPASIILFLLTASITASSLDAGATGKLDSCNPVVKLNTGNTNLVEVLRELAQTHDFDLVFPRDKDRQVRVEEGLSLSELLKYLTSGLSVVTRHTEMAGCDEPKLVSLEVLPDGEQSEFITVVHSRSNKRHAVSEYIYIADMDKYVEEVILKKRRAEKLHMTPEQRLEFKHAKKRIKEKLKKEHRMKKTKLKDEEEQ